MNIAYPIITGSISRLQLKTSRKKSGDLKANGLFPFSMFMEEKIHTQFFSTGLERLKNYLSWEACSLRSPTDLDSDK
jgi:hypothetical protein